ncbi:MULTISPECIES: YkvI family membrane protein [Mammaliicoccus]|uniref:Membrane protein YkvI n=1 Tax=Mammaliicoccus fleurettii TaxID=150056 RepID=A0ABS5MPX3_9STAP|nr:MULTISPECIES: hypothetical protein [Mammaliicoccus]MBL0847987.1 hypothetical protein [Mammaliicoccus fleurettii]MBS3672745.1 hypothetical protein [Mammaliicoccus fleurettii]MBS3697691.1 hypothetical protein [Mammaliicoccus fleurettii]MBW0764867.1 hypothetical protein [Mammaliicoccus fleurettii]MEB7805938.1 hypothetical protein [Mammaliicoccus fleurettii]
MKRIFLIASAFIGVIVGAGFASGQEVLQYFTSFGVMGIFGGIITTALFAYVGMMLVWLGSKMKTDSHKEVIHKVTGKSAFGSIVGWTIDLVIIFTLFGVGVVMLAGAGSNLSQQFGLAPIIGTLIMTVLILLAGMLKVEGVVKIIGNITPFLIVFIVIISVYSFFTVDTSFAELNKISDSYSSTLPNWFIAGINYASFNTAVGASMAIVMGGAEKDSKIAGMGGLLGGLALGVMIILSHLAIFSKLDTVGDLDMPMLGIVNEISPILGVFMAIVIFSMIFNTGLGMFYAFASRFTFVGTNSFKIFYIVSVIVGSGLSFVGFTDLVAIFYPLIGYLGLVLILVLIYAPFKMKFGKKEL